MLKKVSWWLVVLVLLYLGLHLPFLTSIPVFADESIYIRWAQLILDQPGRYAFFALNDGKTPLFIWSLLPFLKIFTDPLVAGRVLSVVVGLGQMLSLVWLVKVLGGKKKAQVTAGILVTFLPYWYLHHRLALMDGMMTLFLTLSVVGVVKMLAVLNLKKFSWTKQRSSLIKWILFTGLSLGLALWSKLPAVLFIPILGFWTLVLSFYGKSRWSRLARAMMSLVAAGLVAGGSFALLRLHPAFGQLFARGSDFLYPISEVLAGRWVDTIHNFPTYLTYFVQYLTPSVILLVIAGLFIKQYQRSNHLLWWSALLFIVPIGLLGRVVYPRYFLPALIFLTAGAALTVEAIMDRAAQLKPLAKSLVVNLILILMLANTVAQSGVFIFYDWTAPNQTPLVTADKSQLLYEWSSGHGIVETVALLTQLSQDKTVAVATEGYFGTLPDALIMYFYNRDVSNLYIEGIGQPVHELTQKFVNRARDFDQSVLVVNSHRMKMDLDPSLLISEFCRPDGAPCLQVWDVTQVVKDFPVTPTADNQTL